MTTDARLSDAQLRGLTKRAALGIERSGSPDNNSPSDIFLAFSVADLMAEPQSLGPVITRHSLNWEESDAVNKAALQAVDEGVINAILQGGVCPAIDTKGLRRIMAQHLRRADPAH